MDYRISPSLESINFVFDRTSGEPILYKSVAKPARPQAHGQELTFVFAPIRLEAREQYRLIIFGDKQAKFTSGDAMTTEAPHQPGRGLQQPARLQDVALRSRRPAEFRHRLQRARGHRQHQRRARELPVVAADSQRDSLRAGTAHVGGGGAEPDRVAGVVAPAAAARGAGAAGCGAPLRARAVAAGAGATTEPPGNAADTAKR